MSACAEPGCVALPCEGSTYCVVHDRTARRGDGSAVVKCYACGERFRIGQRFIVRAEGAFHARFACLGADPETYATQILTSKTGEQEHGG